MTPARRRHLALLAIWTNPVWQDRSAICRKIADAVGASERKYQRAVGADWETSYRADWSTADDAYVMLMGPDHAEVLTTFRPMPRAAVRTVEMADV